MTDTPAEPVILVALVDDNRISREEHAKLLNAAPGVTVISAEATLSVTMLTEAQPDVVLVEAGARTASAGSTDGNRRDSSAASSRPTGSG